MRLITMAKTAMAAAKRMAVVWPRSNCEWSSVVVSGHQRSSTIISDHQRSSVVISGHQWSSVALTWPRSNSRNFQRLSCTSDSRRSSTSAEQRSTVHMVSVKMIASDEMSEE
jgi:hypothetical protein